MHDANAAGGPGGEGPPASAAPFNVQTHFSWIRTRLSAERTLMSWERTAIALIGFGFTIYQFFEKFHESTAPARLAGPDAPRNVGLAFVLIGTLAALIAAWQYWEVGRYLGGKEFAPNGHRPGLPSYRYLTLTVAVFLAFVGIVTSIWMLTRL